LLIFTAIELTKMPNYNYTKKNATKNFNAVTIYENRQHNKQQLFTTSSTYRT